jgi:hypothetical protein
MDMQRSTSGGDIFGTRTAPAAIADVVLEAANTLYMGSGANVYKSTNGAWFFGLPISGKVAAVWSLAMAPTYPDKPEPGHLLVGGTGGGVSLSTDGAASFSALVTAPALATNMQVLADRDYLDNNLVYAGSNTLGQGVFRYEVGVSQSWENIRIPNGAATTGAEQVTGLAMYARVLYASWDDATVGALARGV